jgi:hypothetical protein
MDHTPTKSFLTIALKKKVEEGNRTDYNVQKVSRFVSSKKEKVSIIQVLKALRIKRNQKPN